METPEVVQRAIEKDLAALGVANGDVILVHSSLSSLGFVASGAETAICALRNAVGAGGTLLMPALSYNYVTREKLHFHVD